MNNSFVQSIAGGLGHMQTMEVKFKGGRAVLIHILCGNQMQLLVDGGAGCLSCNFHSSSTDVRKAIGPLAHDSLFSRSDSLCR